MVNMSMRIVIAALGVAVVILGTTSYYSEVIECLQRLKGVADNCVPAILAIGGVYQIVSTMIKKK